MLVEANLVTGLCCPIVVHHHPIHLLAQTNLIDSVPFIG